MNDPVLTRINQACKEKHLSKTLKLCHEYKMPHFGLFVSTALLQQRKDRDDNDDLIKYHTLFSHSTKNINIQLLCDWCTSYHLSQLWSKMLIHSNITLTDKDPDYWIIINAPPPDAVYDKKKTIVFQMKPNMTWCPRDSDFLSVITHEKDYNNIEWHLSKNVSELLSMTFNKNKSLSAILSDKYYDTGHVKRVDFVKALEQHMNVDVYGSNVFDYKHYCGPLPIHEKDNGLFPYKYHFNAERNRIRNYFSEKLIDAILSETLCFYWGCPNVADYIDERAFVVLDLDDIEGSIEKVKTMIENDEWSKRIDIIKIEKRKILTEMNMFQRIRIYLNN